jgi:chloramphenicol O-acetyltransferase type A
VCVRLDVAALKQALQARGGGGLALACHFVALAATREVTELRCRFAGEQGVQVMPVVHASTTVLRDDGSFGFALLRHHERFSAFAAGGRDALQTARGADGVVEPDVPPESLIHCTTLPWLHFTSFTHARDAAQDADIPKLAFGQVVTDGPHAWLPLAIEVHHALVDGLHVGRYVQHMQQLFNSAPDWIDT